MWENHLVDFLKAYVGCFLKVSDVKVRPMYRMYELKKKFKSKFPSPLLSNVVY